MRAAEKDPGQPVVTSVFDADDVVHKSGGATKTIRRKVSLFCPAGNERAFDTLRRRAIATRTTN